MNIARRVASWTTAWLEAYLPAFRRRRPAVGIELGPWLPGWALRLLPAVTVVGLSLSTDSGPVARFAVVVVAVAVFVWPSGPAPAVAAIGYAVLLATDPVPPSPMVAAVFIAALPALVQFGAILGRTGLTARIELAVLVPALRRFLAVQLLVQPVALAGQWLADGALLSGPRWILLPVVAVLGLIVFSFGWLPRLRVGSPADARDEPVKQSP